MKQKHRATNEEIDAVYDEWKKAELDDALGCSTPEYMVQVIRFVGRHAKRSEYFFALEETANKCLKFWKTRGGIAQVMVCKILYEYGLTQEPDMKF